MLFNYPSFINKNEQSESRLLFNSIRMDLQTNIKEIWYDINFGTNIRGLIKKGINALVVAEIQNSIEDVVKTYFKDDIQLNYLDAWQDNNKIKVNLTYTELKTGKKNTIKTEETFVNTDVSLY